MDIIPTITPLPRAPINLIAYLCIHRLKLQLPYAYIYYTMSNAFSLDVYRLIGSKPTVLHLIATKATCVYPITPHIIYFLSTDPYLETKLVKCVFSF
uniref:Putative ovule protein n=1 Tax=Solanum chacoense TaxID=4108 RepID=A0A0V0GPZ4_SOLCH